MTSAPARLLPRSVVAGFVATFGILIAALLIGLGNLRDVYTASEAVAHANAAKDALDGLLLTLVNAETGERGFVITGEESYLDPYTHVTQTLDTELATVRRLTLDSRDQQNDLNSLSALTRTKLLELNDAILQRRQTGLLAAQSVVETNRGKHTMDEMRTIIARMEAREDAALAVRTAAAASSYRYASVTDTLTTSVAMLAVAGLFLAARRIGRGLESEHAARLEAESAARMREDFLAIASHELRNPVNAIQLHVFSLRRGLDDGGTVLSGDALRQRIDHTAAHVARLVHMMDNLLDASRIGARSLSLELEDVDLRRLVEDTLEQFQEELTRVAVTVQAPPAPIVGRWDRLRLQQVVTNLLSNALKYGERRPVEIVLTSGPRTARLEVRDHGIGIAPEQQTQLFGRFARAVSGRQYGGFGLGLWITRQIVEAMGGDIVVESEPGRGSTFSVVVPLRGQANT